MQITKKCYLTSSVNTYDIDITSEQYQRVLNRFATGEVIQKIVPHLEKWEREFLMTGMAKEAQEDFFNKFEEL